MLKSFIAEETYSQFVDNINRYHGHDVKDMEGMKKLACTLNHIDLRVYPAHNRLIQDEITNIFSVPKLIIGVSWPSKNDYWGTEWTFRLIFDSKHIEHLFGTKTSIGDTFYIFSDIFALQYYENKCCMHVGSGIFEPLPTQDEMIKAIKSVKHIQLSSDIWVDINHSDGITKITNAVFRKKVHRPIKISDRMPRDIDILCTG